MDGPGLTSALASRQADVALACGEETGAALSDRRCVT